MNNQTTIAESINFDYVAQVYDATRAIPDTEIVPIIRAIQQAGDIHPETKILEIGIGTGRIALPLARICDASVWGCDISTDMLKILSQKQTDEQVYASIGDALALPFPDNTFDVVLSVHVFHLIPQTQQLLSEIQRVLKPEGRLVYSYGTMGAKELVWHTIENTLDVISRKKHINIARWKQPDILSNYGWLRSDNPIQHVYEETYLPIDLLDQIQQRRWSLLVDLDEQELAIACDVAEKCLLNKYGYLNKPASVESSFCISIYTPPLEIPVPTAV